VSGPFTPTAEDLRAVARFLDGLTNLSRRTGVVICVYDNDYVQVGDVTMRIGRRGESPGVTYAVDDRIGS
jgi:hypothetical protein